MKMVADRHRYAAYHNMPAKKTLFCRYWLL